MAPDSAGPAAHPRERSVGHAAVAEGHFWAKSAVVTSVGSGNREVEGMR